MTKKQTLLTGGNINLWNKKNLFLITFKERSLKMIFLTILMSIWEILIKILSLECLKITERLKSKILTIPIFFGSCHKNLMSSKMKNKNKNINNFLKHIKIQDWTIKKTIRKSNRNQFNRQIRELQFILVKDNNADAHQAGEVKRCKYKENFSQKSKKFKVKRYNKSNKNSKNINNQIHSFWKE